LEKTFPNSSVEAFTSRIVKIIKLLPAKVQSDFFTIEVNLFTAVTSRKWANTNNYVVSLESDSEHNLDS